MCQAQISLTLFTKVGEMSVRTLMEVVSVARLEDSRVLTSLQVNRLALLDATVVIVVVDISSVKRIYLPLDI